MQQDLCSGRCWQLHLLSLVWLYLYTVVLCKHRWMLGGPSYVLCGTRLAGLAPSPSTSSLTTPPMRRSSRASTRACSRRPQAPGARQPTALACNQTMTTRITYWRHTILPTACRTPQAARGGCCTSAVTCTLLNEVLSTSIAWMVQDCAEALQKTTSVTIDKQAMTVCQSSRVICVGQGVM